VSGHHEGPVRAERVKERGGDGVRAAADVSERAHRAVHEERAAGAYAQIAKLRAE
jgi:hypothetical protein